MEAKLYVGNLPYLLLNNYQLGEHSLKVNLAQPRIDRSSGYRR
jgi:hypothetical protein